MIRAILIDDEALGRDALRKSLELYCPQVHLIAEADTAEAGIKLIESLEPELIFLDIAMPVKNGFELLKSLHKINFEIIFVTAHDDYTIQAIRFSAIDYLLKPYDEKVLIEAVSRVEKKILEKSGHQQFEVFINNMINKLPVEHMQLCIASSKGLQILNINDIICCEAQNSYTIFYLPDNGQVVSSKPIGEYENLLSEARFVRIHKSWLINLKHLKEYRKGEGGFVVLSNNKELEVARRKKDFFVSELKKHVKF